MKKKRGADGPTSHSSLVVFWRPLGEDGAVELLAFQYSVPRNGHPYLTWRFPNETGEIAETALQTAVSCADQEVAQSPDEFRCVFSNDDKPVWCQERAGDSDKGGGRHTKCVFVAQVTGGDLRTTPKQEVGKGDRPVETLGPPMWFEARNLLQLMEERGLQFHRQALKRALGFLAVNPSIASNYQDLLETVT